MRPIRSHSFGPSKEATLQHPAAHAPSEARARRSSSLRVPIDPFLERLQGAEERDAEALFHYESEMTKSKMAKSLMKTVRISPKATLSLDTGAQRTAQRTGVEV